MDPVLLVFCFALVASKCAGQNMRLHEVERRTSFVHASSADVAASDATPLHTMVENGLWLLRCTTMFDSAWFSKDAHVMKALIEHHRGRSVMPECCLGLSM
eukprot:4800807-Amphidinium_carterae.1